MTPRGLLPEQRFDIYVDPPDEHGCHVWSGAKSGPYGKFFVGRDEQGKTIVEYAHRFANALAFGPIPEGVEVDHTCPGLVALGEKPNRLCCNPAHHERVSPHVNKSRQGARQTRCVHGHAYTPANTYIDPRGMRRCRACASEMKLAA
jgi:hypothetical protein